MRPRFLALVLRLQWLDRAATSSFLVGITIQTAILAAAVYESSTGAEQALALALRGAVFSVVGVLLFSSMSSITNEVELGTLESVVIGAVSFPRLIALRSAATALIASPAILAPFAAAALRWPALWTDGRLWSAGFHVYALAAVLGYQLSWLLNCFESPRTALQWTRYALLLTGLELVPLPGGAALAQLSPIAHLLRGDDGAFWLTLLAWTAAVQLLAVGRVLASLERRLCDQRMR